MSVSSSKLYANILAKVGAERSYLLSKEKFKSLTECKSLEEFASELQNTVYAEDLRKVTPPYSSTKFEKAFHENFIRVNYKILENSPKEVSQFLEIFLLRFENNNIKTILRGVKVKLSYEEILNRIYLDIEDYFKRHDIFEKASEATDIKAVVDIFRDTIYGEPLDLGLKQYEKTESLKFFDIPLDKMFYEHLDELFTKLPENEQQHAYSYMSLEIDSYILLTILRAKILNYDPEFIRRAIPNNSIRLPPKNN